MISQGPAFPPALTALLLPPLLLAVLCSPISAPGGVEAAFFAWPSGGRGASALPPAGVLAGGQELKAPSAVGLRGARAALSAPGAITGGSGGGPAPSPRTGEPRQQHHLGAGRPPRPRDHARFDRDGGGGGGEAAGPGRAGGADAGAAPSGPVPLGTWRRVYVASLHTKPDQQGRAFQLTLPDPWATGCYAVDVGAASFSELHRDFRLELFAAEECQGGAGWGGGGGGGGGVGGAPAVSLPPPPPARSGPASLQTALGPGGAPDEGDLYAHGGRAADRTRGNFPGPLRVRSVRFQRLP